MLTTARVDQLVAEVLALSYAGRVVRRTEGPFMEHYNYRLSIKLQFVAELVDA